VLESYITNGATDVRLWISISGFESLGGSQVTFHYPLSFVTFFKARTIGSVAQRRLRRLAGVAVRSFPFFGWRRP
jgi:hypothetical protein